MGTLRFGGDDSSDARPIDHFHSVVICFIFWIGLYFEYDFKNHLVAARPFFRGCFVCGAGCDANFYHCQCRLVLFGFFGSPWRDFYHSYVALKRISDVLETRDAPWVFFSKNAFGQKVRT